ncbi:MAG TPA: glycoside hydrolase family 20 zincin-like fold domain-containing protein, partial [Armatimonadota bacterium]|nr:glycoside hydrolase family 20 zincin-like fold domain-containing protein [Armatimonadota bacterium]
MNQIAIVPKPVMLETTGGDFTITAKTKILVENDSSDAAGAGKYLAGMFYRGTGLNLPVGRLTGGISTRDAIVLTTKGADARLGSEGYR